MGTTIYYCCNCMKCVNPDHYDDDIYEENRHLFKKNGYPDSINDIGIQCSICYIDVCEWCTGSIIKRLKGKMNYVCSKCSETQYKHTVIKNKVEDIQKVQYAGDEWFDKINELLVYIKPNYKTK